MKTNFEKIIENCYFRVTIFVLVSVFPALEFYVKLFKSIFSPVKISNLSFGDLIDIFTGLLLGLMFLLFTQSRKEYYLIKRENKRIKEILLTIHTFDNLRFQKLKSSNPKLFENEEVDLRSQIYQVFNKDLHKDYQEQEINEIMDCFYRHQPKF
jgi:hypothetical protein